jgi:hypothetical protein
MHHLNLERILAYVAEKMDYEELLDTEEHLSRCAKCAKRVRAHRIIRTHFDELMQGWIARSHAEASRKVSGKDPIAAKRAVEKERIRTLTESFGRVIAESAGKGRLVLEQVFMGLYDLFVNSFAFPAPAFSPVFGEGKVTVLSPFGKIRPPVLFAWAPVPNAERYTISIVESGWSREVSETEVTAGQEDLGIEYGSEYMWNLKMMSRNSQLQEFSGFFHLAKKEEIEEMEMIERQLDGIGEEIQRLIILAGILEQKEFYQEAAVRYQEAFKLEAMAGIAYRIASCYDRLELEELRDRWNKEVLRQNYVE